jgi:plastocyanin
MRTSIAVSVLALLSALTAWNCGGSPASPSALNSLGSASVAAGSRLRALEDAPPADPMPMPDPALIDPAVPTPMAVIIQIVSAFGSGAFMPNPTTANVGDQLVFTNTDAVLHHIVLDNGTDVGNVAPGATTRSIAVNSSGALGFHCTIHPSMVGSINAELAAPDPYYPPPDDYYGYY